MSQLNIDTNKMEADIERHLTNQVPSGEATTLFEKQYKIALSAIRHLQLATSEARKMNSHSIQGEHLLLALIMTAEPWTAISCVKSRKSI